MRLSDLIEGIGTIEGEAHSDSDILGLTADSRRVRPGYLFAAIPGSKVDGRTFIAQAIAAGARAILTPPDTEVPAGVAHLVEANPRRALALMAARYYGAQPRTIAAVTGTNGKTSVASFTRQLWALAGHKAAALGTLGLVAPGRAGGPSLTTPDPVALHETLAELVGEGIQHLAIEASSHGLDQNRLDGMHVSAAAFTNLTRDHLDYHGSFDAYRAAKLRLFDTLLDADGAAVVNAESPEFAAVAQAARQRGVRLISYGLTRGDLRCLRRTPTADGWQLELDILGDRHSVDLPLPGDFQIANALCALGLAIGCGADPAATAPLLARLGGVPGRMELAGATADGAPVFVDYAHTPDALATVLPALRPHVARRLLVVFGCGGDRDTGKRAEMGAIASRLADHIIVTDDNPRSENPAAIRRMIMAACPDAEEIGDRRQAIAAAVRALGAGDVLVIAGKGHETGQIVGATILPFQDITVARDVLSAQAGGQP